jgi:hypothetical protein
MTKCVAGTCLVRTKPPQGERLILQHGKHQEIVEASCHGVLSAMFSCSCVSSTLSVLVCRVISFRRVFARRNIIFIAIVRIAHLCQVITKVTCVPVIEIVSVLAHCVARLCECNILQNTTAGPDGARQSARARRSG